MFNFSMSKPQSKPSLIYLNFSLKVDFWKQCRPLDKHLHDYTPNNPLINNY